MKMNIFITIWMTMVCNAFAATDPNIKQIQFWGTADYFIVHEEREPRTIIYKTMDPNLAGNFSWKIDNAKTYQLNSIAALHYLSYHWPYFINTGGAMNVFNIVSRYWKPVIDPNRPPAEVEIVNPVWATKSGTKYHTETCRYAATATKISMVDAVDRGLTACNICNPYPPEPNEPTLEEVLIGAIDPNLINFILEALKQK